MLTIFIRTIIIYIFLILVMRLMGKRQLGDLRITELVLTFMLSELAVVTITDKKIPLALSIFPIIVILSLEAIISFLTSHYPLAKTIFVGKPSVLIKKGKLDTNELSRLRIGVSDLASELRLKDVFKFSDVEYAIIEDNGKLSVCKKIDQSTVTVSQLGLSEKESGIDHTIINEGKISKSGLDMAEKDMKWLHRIIKDKNLKVKDIYLFSSDDCGNVYIILKEGKIIE